MILECGYHVVHSSLFSPLMCLSIVSSESLGMGSRVEGRQYCLTSFVYLLDSSYIQLVIEGSMLQSYALASLL
jgi:hypothetical protein